MWYKLIHVTPRTKPLVFHRVEGLPVSFFKPNFGNRIPRQSVIGKIKNVRASNPNSLTSATDPEASILYMDSGTHPKHGPALLHTAR